MKKFISILISILLVTLCFSISFATDDDGQILYIDDSGDLVESEDNTSGDEPVLINNEDDYEDLVTSSENSSAQEELKKDFEISKKNFQNIPQQK